MSIESSALPEDEARKAAEQVLRFQIGPQYSLGDPDVEDGEYVFPVLIRRPRVIFDETRSHPVDVKYLSPKEVGEITIDASGETDYTHPQTIYRRVRDFEAEIQEAVEKALISASAKDFTKLPFPENRYAPVEDILSEIILRKKIPAEEISELEPSDEDKGKYWDYIHELEGMGLLRRENGNIKAGNILTSIEQKKDENHEKLNVALSHYFKENVHDLETLHQVLGPYLAIAGFYYRLAIESDVIPVVDEEELRDAFKRHYKGKGRRTKQKEFKMSRYLLHLERAGILKTKTRSNSRVWYGNEKVKNDLEEQSQHLGTVSDVIG